MAKKDARKQPKTPSPSPSPDSSPAPTSRAPSSGSTPRQPITWWLRRLFRVGALIGAGLYAYPYFFPSPSPPSLGGPLVINSQPITLDAERRGAVLDAFKVRGA